MEQSYYKRHREERKAKARERYWKKRDEIRVKQAEYREKNPELNKRYYEENREYYRDYHDRRRRSNPGRKYGLSAETYWKMVEDSKGVCKICKLRMDKVCVDHDHTTKKVRGLLCHPCNVSLGLMKDDPLRLERAAIYLKESQNEAR